MVTRILIGLLIGVGVFMILADLLYLPKRKTVKAMKNYARQQEHGQMSSLDIKLSSVASALSKRIKINEFKRMQLESDLKTAQMDITPEMYTANAIIKAMLIGVLAIPMIFIFPIGAPIVLILAGVLYKINMKSVEKKIQTKRALIEYELPKFVFKIERTLVHNKDILYILESFAPHTSPELRHELEITAADMRSGNQELAITRLEARVGSAQMSDVCRGLISLSRGDVNTVYWTSLSMKLADIQRQRLRAEANKIPKKTKKLSMIMLICFMLAYIVVMGSLIVDGMGVIFA